MSSAQAKDDVVLRKDAILAPLDRRRYTTLDRLARDAGHRLVVSFGGGSVPGICGNIALAKILEELDLRERVEHVWGTSAGAAVGGPWASGTPADRIYDVILTMNRRGAVDVPWFRLALSLLLRPLGGRLPDGLVRGRHFMAALAGALSVETFEECPTPFRCIACTDDGRCRRKIFRRGRILPAIFASMSIPGVVMPRPRQEGETTGFYDGGLVEKTPLISPIAEHSRIHANKKLLLIGTHYGNEAWTASAEGFVLRFLQSINVLEDELWQHQLRDARDRSNVLLLMLNPRLEDPSLFDFGRVERNYLRAREAYADALQNARLALSFGIR